MTVNGGTTGASEGQTLETDEKNANPIEVVQAALDADILVYNGPINYESFYDLLEFTKFKQRPNALVLLSTSGGDPDAAYRIGRCLQARYDKLTIYIAGICKSAGTLVTLAADDVVIGDAGEMGPLDIQLRKRDELLEVGSGLDTTKALDFLLDKSLSAFRRYMLDVCMGARISTKTAASIATDLTVGLFGKLYEQIDPVRLAETMRATAIAMSYGSRLSKNLHDDALNRLVHTYPAHSFVIDFAEAKSLFKKVRQPTDAETQMLSAIECDFCSPHEDETVIFAVNPPAQEHGDAKEKQ